MSQEMHLVEESGSQTMKLPSPTEDFYGTQNTSNNGYRYIPGDNEKEHLSDVYKCPHSILKKHVTGSSCPCTFALSDTTVECNQHTKLEEQSEIEDPDIEIVITQDVTNGLLFFNIVATDELQEFTNTLNNMQVLAASGTVRIPATQMDEEAKTQTVYRRPGAGDHLLHTPGILHVPNINDTAATKDRRNVKFQPGGECSQRRRSRLATRQHESQYQRKTGKNRTNDLPASQSRSSRPVSKSPSEETNAFYNVRYHNTNTYCFSQAQRNVGKTESKHSAKPGHSDRPVSRNKTGASFSEGDLNKNRPPYFKDKSIEKKTILKQDKNKSSVDIQDRNKGATAKDRDNTISEPTDKLEKSQTQSVPKLKVCTESVTAPGSRPRLTQSGNQTKNENVNEDKQKKKKRNRGNRNKKIDKPQKTKLQIIQHQIELGQLKSFFSKYKTEALKNIRMIEEMHVGTYCTKYKGSYQNESVVLSVYVDQDVSDIAAVDMAHMRGSYFVQSVKDCIRGPGGSLWLLTPYCRLGDLHKLLMRDERRHVFGERQAQFVTASLLLAIHYLHRNHIVHGNIKPSKILLNNQGFPVLTGFVKVYEDAVTEKRDVYTPAYAAPDRFRGERGEAVDVFSIGCIAYEIITGRTPFDGENLDGTKAKILSSTCQPRFDPELISYAGENFLKLCLRKKSSERFNVRDNINNMREYEWFTRLDFSELRRQVVTSPILEAIQLINNHAKLSWEEKAVSYKWGRVMDELSPDNPCIGD